MSGSNAFICTAFAGARCIGSGPLPDVAVKAKAEIERDADQPVLIFEDATGEIIDVDYRGSESDVRKRLASWAEGPSEPSPATRRGPGRPKLGVVAREVTLLPRHWAWLGEQPGGASVALRKLVDEARRRSEGKDSARRAQNAAYRFMSAMAGDRPGFEEATRALFAGDAARFDEMVEAWPDDIREHTRKLAAGAFQGHAEKATPSSRR